MGDRKQKPWRKPLDEKWVKALLHGRVPHDEKGSISAYIFLHSAKETYQEALRVAREKLEEHPLIGIAAQEAARLAGRRGNPSIIIDDTGRVMLEIRYGASPKRGKSGLPSLAELRKKAEEAGVDISDLGRAKRKIMERLSEAPKAEKKAKKKAKKKMTKTAPAIGPVRLVTVESEPDPPKKEADPEPELRPGSMAAMAAEGAKRAENLDEFLAEIDDEYDG